MKNETIRKYVKDIDGLLEEMSEVQAIPAVDVYETAVIFIFGRIFRFLKFDDMNIGHGEKDDLDAIAWLGQDDIVIEFEARSKNFLKDKHDVNKCDLIVCWEDNWKECPIDVMELKYFWEKAQENFCKK